MKQQCSLIQWGAGGLLALLMLHGAPVTQAQGTSFTYQGFLTDGTNPANGSYDLVFSLYDAERDGNQVGSSLTNTAVAVNNGMFMVPLDFGPGIFEGSPRWLEISVSPNGGDRFETLSPRQAVTPTPYAIYATSASQVATGSIASDQISTPVAPVDGQVLAYSDGSLRWKDPASAGSIWSLNGRHAYYTNGAVAIGTATPQADLHLYHPENSVTEVIETGGSINAWAKVAFRNANGDWHIGTSRGFNGDVFYVDRIGATPLEFQLAPNGNLGLGATPVAKLHLYDPENSLSQRIETGGGVNAWARIEFLNANGQWNLGTSRGYNGDQLYFARQGSGTIAFAIQPNGDAFVERNLSTCSLTIRGGCDLAEPFPMKEDEIDKGSVVVIDDEHPGRLKLSSQAYDTRVAGIVSGANGINPGISLRQEGAMDEGQNVALSGRVYVQADASFGAIRPGDLLTTSDTPGHAMKVNDHSRAQGAILGKAMSRLSEGKGMVLVLVTLQ